MRMFDLFYEDYFQMKREEILSSIKSTEGRTIMAETIISTFPLLDGVSNPETAAAFSADMVTLNTFNFEAPFVFGYDDSHLSPLIGITKLYNGDPKDYPEEQRRPSVYTKTEESCRKIPWS